MNGYQKLRQRIKELEEEKQILIEQPESYEATLIKAGYQHNKRFEEVVMFGSKRAMSSTNGPLGFFNCDHDR
jgi:hypothetical protein